MTKYDHILQLTDHINDIITMHTSQEKSNIVFHPTTVCKDEYGTWTFLLYGGKNGCGKWEDYFQDLSNFTDRLKGGAVKKLWLIKLENDCPDDVFTATFGFEF